MADYYSARRQMQFALRVDMVGMLQGAIEEQGRAVQGMARFIGKTFGDLQGSHPNLLRDAHQHVGDDALRSAQQGFRNRKFRRPTGHYRTDQQRLSGRLASSLSNPKHVHATPRLLEFIDVDLLDKEARHWRRLNFGAGTGSREGIQAPKQFPVTWGGVAVGTIGLEMEPSPAFRVPRGYWIDSGGKRVGASQARVGLDRFFLPGMSGTGGGRRRASPVTATAGIGSRNFLDAGVRRVANELPRAYEGVYVDLFTRSRGTLDALARTYGARVVRPKRQSISYFRR